MIPAASEQAAARGFLVRLRLPRALARLAAPPLRRLSGTQRGAPTGAGVLWATEAELRLRLAVLRGGVRAAPVESAGDTASRPAAAGPVAKRGA